MGSPPHTGERRPRRSSLCRVSAAWDWVSHTGVSGRAPQLCFYTPSASGSRGKRPGRGHHARGNDGRTVDRQPVEVRDIARRFLLEASQACELLHRLLQGGIRRARVDRRARPSGDMHYDDVLHTQPFSTRGTSNLNPTSDGSSERPFPNCPIPCPTTVLTGWRPERATAVSRSWCGVAG